MKKQYSISPKKKMVGLLPVGFDNDDSMKTKTVIFNVSVSSDIGHSENIHNVDISAETMHTIPHIPSGWKIIDEVMRCI